MPENLMRGTRIEPRSSNHPPRGLSPHRPPERQEGPRVTLPYIPESPPSPAVAEVRARPDISRRTMERDTMRSGRQSATRVELPLQDNPLDGAPSRMTVSAEPRPAPRRRESQPATRHTDSQPVRRHTTPAYEPENAEPTNRAEQTQAALSLAVESVNERLTALERVCAGLVMRITMLEKEWEALEMEREAAGALEEADEDTPEPRRESRA